MRHPKLVLPISRPGDKPYTEFCLNDDWVKVLINLGEYLEYPSTWADGTDFTDQYNKVMELTYLLVLAKGGRQVCCCGGGGGATNQRYNADGHLEVSYDGGRTWEVADNQDPRFNAPIFPALPGADGEDKRCRAAASGAEFFKTELIEELQTGQGFTEIMGIVTVLLAPILGVAAPPLAAVLTTAIMAATISAVQAAFTSAVYEEFKCILYCRMSDDAMFTAASWALVRSDINAKLSGIAAVILENWVYTIGAAGLTNICRTGIVLAADCTSCECEQQCYSWYSNDLGEGIVTIAQGHFATDPDSSEPVVHTDGNGYEATWTLPTPKQLDVIAYSDKSNGGNGRWSCTVHTSTGNHEYVFFDGNTNAYNWYQYAVNAPPGVTTSITIRVEGRSGLGQLRAARFIACFS